MAKIGELSGDYCPLCVEAMTRSKTNKGLLFVMCREDFDQFLHNGDWDKTVAMLAALTTPQEGQEK